MRFDSLTSAEQDRLAVAARPLWDALNELGWTDSPGGAEFQRVFPEAVEFIHRQSNMLPGEAYDALAATAAVYQPKED